MFGHDQKAIFMTSIVAALVLGAAAAYLAPGVNALQGETARDDGSGRLAIWVTEGKISGTFDYLPLVAVLAEVSDQATFEYQGDDELLQRPVSGNFDGVPVVDALKQLLEPFNYVILFTSDGAIKELHIISLRRDVAGSGPAPASIPFEGSGFRAPFADEDLEDLSIEDRALFEMADEKLSPPPELLEDFEPWMEPGSEETGPHVPIDIIVEELPEFETFVSETGPIGPDVVVEELPEFEPFVSETGPSIELPENE